jgi:hypothetical protein
MTTSLCPFCYAVVLRVVTNQDSGKEARVHFNYAFYTVRRSREVIANLSFASPLQCVLPVDVPCAGKMILTCSVYLTLFSAVLRCTVAPNWCITESRAGDWASVPDVRHPPGHVRLFHQVLA